MIISFDKNILHFKQGDFISHRGDMGILKMENGLGKVNSILRYDQVLLWTWLLLKIKHLHQL